MPEVPDSVQQETAVDLVAEPALDELLPKLELLLEDLL